MTTHNNDLQLAKASTPNTSTSTTHPIALTDPTLSRHGDTMSQSGSTYTDRGFHIAAHLLEGLERYIQYGEVPGDFLIAVIENNLQEAVSRADSEVIQNLPAYVFFLYNKAPQGCWGSREKLRAWIAKFGTEQPAQACRGQVMSRYDLERANRPELVVYLEAHGFTCGDHEHTGILRFAALLNHDTKGA